MCTQAGCFRPQEMKALALCVMGAALMWGAAGKLPPPERSYKILVLFPVASKSHRNSLMAVAEALADRGHKVRPTCPTVMRQWPLASLALGAGLNAVPSSTD